MKAEDTVMDDETLVARFGAHPVTENVQPYRSIVWVQAELSFKAGYEVALMECGEWLEKQTKLTPLYITATLKQGEAPWEEIEKHE